MSEIKMCNGKAVRVVGVPFPATSAGRVFDPMIKQKMMQRVEFITSGAKGIVPVESLNDVTEPKQFNV